MNVYVTDSKEFSSMTEFTGQDILELIKAHDLQDYNLRSIEREYVQPVNGMSSMNKYRYILVFSRREQ